MKTLVRTSLLVLFCMCAWSVFVVDIGGSISSTLTITEDSQLVDDVTRTHQGHALYCHGRAEPDFGPERLTVTRLADPLV
jgi:hypothetical protein